MLKIVPYDFVLRTPVLRPMGPCSARSKLLQAILSNLRMPGPSTINIAGVLPCLYHHARQPNIFNSKFTFEILHNDAVATGLNLLQQS